MVKMAVFCDFCELPMPEDADNNVKLFITKEIETRKLYPHLCERCATKIDAAVRFNRKLCVSKSELAAKMAKINDERKERLRTKG